MLFANRSIGATAPSIMDIGPTVLDLLGVPVPPWCDGRSLLADAAEAQSGVASRGGSAVEAATS